MPEGDSRRMGTGVNGKEGDVKVRSVALRKFGMGRSRFSFRCGRKRFEGNLCSQNSVFKMFERCFGRNLEEDDLEEMFEVSIPVMVRLRVS